MEHGEVRITTTKVGDNAVYRKTEKYCAVHGWIDLFTCGDFPGWNDRHALCDSIEQSHGIGLELPKAMAKAA